MDVSRAVDAGLSSNMFCRLCGSFQKKSVLCWCWEDLQLSHAWEPAVIITQGSHSSGLGHKIVEKREFLFLLCVRVPLFWQF